jgi:putative membrane protein
VRYLPHLLLLAGFALLLAILLHYGLADILAAFAAAGWGVGVVALFHLVPLVLDAMAWQMLVRPPERLTPWAAILLRWIAEAVNTLLPTASVGGEFARVRLAGFEGVPGAIAGASVIVDVTLGVITQGVFALMGLALLARIHGADDGLMLSAALGAAVFALLATVMFVLQKRGVFSYLTQRFARLPVAARWRGLAGDGAALDRAIAALYAQRRLLLVSALWRLAGWVAGAGEIWLALHFLGHPVGLGEAILVESLVQAVRTAAFFVPAAIGVQEAGFVLICGAIGVPAQPALALALVKRARELLLGLPGLAAWQMEEAARLRRSDARGHRG